MILFSFRLSPPQISYDTDGEAHGAVADVIDVEPTSFNACSRSSSQDTQNTAAAATVTASDSKWSCKMCTYLNWPRSLRCVQCYTKKGVSSNDTSSPSQDIGAISVASFKQQQCELEQNLTANIQKHKRLSDNLDPKSIIDCSSMAESIINTSQQHHTLNNPQQQLQERLNKLHIGTNIEAEMNASNNAASANAAANTGAAAQRLSPVETSTIHLNNLANSSQTQQQQQQLHQQQQSTSSTATTSACNPQQASYIKKWACNV